MVRLLAWTGRSTRAVERFDTWYGALWTVVVAVVFFWLSNPLVIEPSFDQSLWRACLTTGIVVLLTAHRIRIPRPSWAVLAVLAFGFASALWSSNQGETVDFTWDYVVIAAIAAVIAANADVRTIAQGMALGGVLVLVMSWYALEKELPGAAVALGNEGYLAGVGTNRNILAYTLVLSLAFAVSFLPRRWWSRCVWAVATGSILLGIYLAQSSTGILSAVVLAGSGLVLAWADCRRRAGVVHTARVRWLVRAVAVALVVTAVLSFEVLGRLLGRDTSSLSGRVPLWDATWDATTGVDRWVGAGWGAVWPHPWNPAPLNPEFDDIIGQSGSFLSHGHNALFDLIPEVGVIGASVFALSYVHALSRAFAPRDSTQRLGRTRLEGSRATLLGVLALLLFGLTEPMSTIPLGWFTIALLACGLATGPTRTRAGPTSSAEEAVPAAGSGPSGLDDDAVREPGRQKRRPPGRRRAERRTRFGSSTRRP